MDPDLVRQQAEEEAASLRPARPAPHAQMRIEPALPMTAPPIAPSAPQSAVAGLFEVAAETTTVTVTAGWRTAIEVATSSTLGVAVGLFGGMMLGVKLQLVPLQSVLIGAASATLLGWQLGALTLRRSQVGWLRAYRLGLRTTLLVLVIVGAGMFVLPHVLEPPSAPNAPFAMGVFWRSMAVGGALALVIGAMTVRRVLRELAAQD